MTSLAPSVAKGEEMDANRGLGPGLSSHTDRHTAHTSAYPANTHRSSQSGGISLSLPSNFYLIHEISP